MVQGMTCECCGPQWIPEQGDTRHHLRHPDNQSRDYIKSKSVFTRSLKLREAVQTYHDDQARSTLRVLSKTLCGEGEDDLEMSR